MKKQEIEDKKDKDHYSKILNVESIILGRYDTSVLKEIYNDNNLENFLAYFQEVKSDKGRILTLSNKVSYNFEELYKEFKKYSKK